MIDILTLAYKEAELFPLKDASGTAIDDAGVPCKFKVKGPVNRRHEDAWRIYQVESFGVPEREANIARARFLTRITERMDCAYSDLTGDDALMAMYSDPKTGFVAEQVFAAARTLDNFKP